MEIFCCNVTVLSKNGKHLIYHHHSTLFDSALEWIHERVHFSIRNGDVIESKTCTTGINC